MMHPLNWLSCIKPLKSEDGLLTVEAILVIPIMLLGFLWMVAFIQAANQLVQIDQALSQVSKEFSNATYTVHQSLGLVREEKIDNLELPEAITRVWAETCFKSHLPDYEVLKPAITWQKACLPPIDEDIVEEWDGNLASVQLQITFQPGKVNSTLSCLLPERLCWILIKEQKPWVIGRELLPYRGIEQSAAAQKTGIIVYVTRWGTRYHREDCRYLAKSKILYDLGELPGFYVSCLVCQPPQRN